MPYRAQIALGQNNTTVSMVCLPEQRAIGLSYWAKQQGLPSTCLMPFNHCCLNSKIRLKTYTDSFFFFPMNELHLHSYTWLGGIAHYHHAPDQLGHLLSCLCSLTVSLDTLKFLVAYWSICLKCLVRLIIAVTKRCMFFVALVNTPCD